MKCPNPLAPDLMSDDERLSEAAEILARGVIRLRRRREGRPAPISGESRESCLDFSPDQRRYVRRNSMRESRRD